MIYIATEEYRQAVTSDPHFAANTNTVGLNLQIEKEPRFNQAHKESMRKVIMNDPNAILVGFDKRMRPVIETRVNRKKVRYALLANGSAAVAGQIHERW